MTKLFIVDSINYLFRSYYAIGLMMNDKGESTNALFGFIRSLQKLIADFSVKNIVAVFDGKDNKKARQALFSEYKANRKKAPDDLYAQIDKTLEFCDLAGIPFISIDEVEADDTIASIAKWASSHYDKIFICTSDKDLMQLVSDKIFVLNTYKDNLILDTKGVKEHFGVFPNQIADYLALSGDASDNIPGVEGFGPKTAEALLNEFHTLENIYDNAEKIKGKKGELLRDQKEQAYLSQKLAQLDFNIDVPKSKDFFTLKPAKEELKQFYIEMKFLKFLKELSPTEEGDGNYELISDLATLEKKLISKEIAIDTETTSLNTMDAKLVGVGFAISEKKAFYLPLNGSIEKEKALAFLKNLIEKRDLKFFGHNIKYDIHVFKNQDIDLQNISFDTLLASYLLNPQSRRHNLDILTLEKFNKVKITIESLIGEKNQKSMEEVELSKISDYCCEDALYTFRLKKLFEKELKEKGLDNVMFNIELPLIPVLVKMERNGIFIDEAKMAKTASSLSAEMIKCEGKIYSAVGCKFNINSPKQLGEVLYNILKLPHPKKSLSTAADVLEKLESKSAVVKDILKYRGLQKLLSTYAEALPKEVNKKTHRIHPTFNQSVTATGRLSCQDPNLQNIPIRSEEGRKIREAFKPEKEHWSFLSADYSQIELRLLAHFSDDPVLIKAFNNDEDIHATTASIVFNVPIKEVTKEMRQIAKTVNFGIIYGQGPYGLSEQLHIPIKQASEFINAYFAKYPKISSFLDKCKKEAFLHKESRTITGRRRPLPEIESKNPTLKALAERLAINTPLQGSSADIIKLVMIEIDKALKNKRSLMILQIHDELLFEVPDNELVEIKKMVKEKMEKIIDLKVPLVVNIAIGKNWAEC